MAENGEFERPTAVRAAGRLDDLTVAVRRIRQRCAPAGPSSGGDRRADQQKRARHLVWPYLSIAGAFWAIPLGLARRRRRWSHLRSRRRPALARRARRAAARAAHRHRPAARAAVRGGTRPTGPCSRGSSRDQGASQGGRGGGRATPRAAAAARPETTRSSPCAATPGSASRALVGTPGGSGHHAIISTRRWFSSLSIRFPGEAERGAAPAGGSPSASPRPSSASTCRRSGLSSPGWPPSPLSFHHVARHLPFEAGERLTMPSRRPAPLIRGHILISLAPMPFRAARHWN